MSSLKDLLKRIIDSSFLHAKWLNTLSYLENCGAKKIAACEHPTLVKEEMLKHAAEEFRHAHHLKRQIAKITTDLLESYALVSLLGGTATLNYLQMLDVKTSRYLKNKGTTQHRLKEISYLLVTYSIERRAEQLYPIYDELLRLSKSPITLKSILLEEKEHLNEMRAGLSQIPSGLLYAEDICAIEEGLCSKWLKAIEREII